MHIISMHSKQFPQHVQPPAGSFCQLAELHLTVNHRPVPGARKEFVPPTHSSTWLLAFGDLPALKHLELEVCAGYESSPEANSAAVNSFVPGAWRFVSRLKTLKCFEFDLTCIPDATWSSLVWSTLATTLRALPQLEKVFHFPALHYECVKAVDQSSAVTCGSCLEPPTVLTFTLIR
jgi:hypothetical protein